MSWLIEEQIKQQLRKNDIDLLIHTPTRDGRTSQHWSLGRQELEMPHGWRVSEARESGQQIDTSRNIACSQALRGNAKYILFYDSDVIPPKHTLNTLLQLQMPVVGAVYRSRGPPFQLLASSGGIPLSDDLLKQPQVVECDTIGAGFLLVDCRVLRKYARRLDNWQCLADHTKMRGEFVAAYSDNIAAGNGYKCLACDGTLVASFFDFRAGKTRKLAVSEDYYFCAKVKELGFKVFAATILCLHENTFCYVGQEPKIETWLNSAADVK